MVKYLTPRNGSVVTCPICDNRYSGVENWWNHLNSRHTNASYDIPHKEGPMKVLKENGPGTYKDLGVESHLTLHRGRTLHECVGLFNANGGVHSKTGQGIGVHYFPTHTTSQVVSTWLDRNEAYLEYIKSIRGEAVTVIGVSNEQFEDEMREQLKERINR